MKFSILTPVYNSASTVTDCMASLASQTYPDIEHIIIDGGSTDGSVETIQRSIFNNPTPNLFRSQNYKIISESDAGIYDALNKGIKIAEGDVIGLLHADDIYFDENVLTKVVKLFEEKKVDSVYGDLVYVDRTDTAKVFRYWKAGIFNDHSLRNGWMPPHPSFFVKKEIYERFGLFDVNLKIAADYDLILRFLGKHKITTHYLPEILVKMRLGGSSNKSLFNIIQKSREDFLALKMNGFSFPLSTLLKKNFSKLPQLFKK